jgi:Kef-type K+ transport system membrane component KefB
MFEQYLTASIWIFLAVISTIMAYRFKIAVTLMEICVGVIAAYILMKFFPTIPIGSNSEWLKFLAGTGAILLTFLSGTELDPQSMKKKIKEVSLIGLMGFFAPFIGCTIIAKFLLHWDTRASLLTGIALSITSMAVVYAVMLEYGFNKTSYGKGILGACFVNDLGTVIALGLIFAPFTYKTIVFIVITIGILIVLPFMTNKIVHIYGNKTYAIRTKWILFILFGLGALALWSGSEAVLPAYLVGMVLATIIGKDHTYIKRLRTLTIGFLTPFYFLRAGSLVSVPAIVSAPIIFLVLFGGKIITKIFGLYPVVGLFKGHKKERWYYTLLMSTGLTFGTISALYGFTNGIINQFQYSFIVAAVIGSAVIPTAIANIRFLPSHLLEIPMADEEMSQDDINGENKKLKS